MDGGLRGMFAIQFGLAKHGTQDLFQPLVIHVPVHELTTMDTEQTLPILDQQIADM
jgi:hypothetical protein